jgi:hypothetical protein
MYRRPLFKEFKDKKIPTEHWASFNTLIEKIKTSITAALSISWRYEWWVIKKGRSFIFHVRVGRPTHVEKEDLGINISIKNNWESRPADIRHLNPLIGDVISFLEDDSNFPPKTKGNKVKLESGTSVKIEEPALKKVKVKLEPL